MRTFKCYTNHKKPVISDIFRMHLPIHISGTFTWLGREGNKERLDGLGLTTLVTIIQNFEFQSGKYSVRGLGGNRQNGGWVTS